VYAEPHCYGVPVFMGVAQTLRDDSTFPHTMKLRMQTPCLAQIYWRPLYRSVGIVLLLSYTEHPMHLEQQAAIFAILVEIEATKAGGIVERKTIQQR